MPYRPEAELKRPDLKGEFTCGVCFKRFCHAASLNRHRLNFHSGNHNCRLCNSDIPNGENLKSHMALRHGIERVFTCGCCNWAFPDKKELHQHTSAMMKTGDPGIAQPIATNLNVAPGSMVAEKSPGLFPRSAPSPPSSSAPNTPHRQISSTPSIPLIPPPIFPVSVMTTDLHQQLLQMLAAQLESSQGPAPAWLRGFLLNNPILPGVIKNVYTNNNDGANSEATDTSHSEDEQSTSTAVERRHEKKSEILPSGSSPLHSQTATPECTGSPLSVEVPSPHSPISTSGQSTSTDADTPASMVIVSPGGTIRKRKRTIDDVVSFLTKKKVVVPI
ncbi:unnamed protein product, partial [Mesorhabditis belari]|uniref:C2H2-type domain-containing protein n=1 Tax=Mesorhabditis belari TaxID=2138241 RepID=A0AAF3EAV1_9BILA